MFQFVCFNTKKSIGVIPVIIPHILTYLNNKEICRATLGILNNISRDPNNLHKVISEGILPSLMYVLGKKDGYCFQVARSFTINLIISFQNVDHKVLQDLPFVEKFIADSLEFPPLEASPFDPNFSHQSFCNQIMISCHTPKPNKLSSIVDQIVSEGHVLTRVISNIHEMFVERKESRSEENFLEASIVRSKLLRGIWNKQSHKMFLNDFKDAVFNFFLVIARIRPFIKVPRPLVELIVWHLSCTV